MKRILIFLLVFVHVVALGQLQPQFTQHMYNPAPFNPGVVGYREAVSTTLSHRQLWSAFEGTPTTQTLAIHSPFLNNTIGAGLLVQQDKIGVSRNFGVKAQAAYRLHLGSGKLSFGIQAGMTNQHDQWSAIETTDAGDASFTMGDTQSWLPDAGAGFYYYSQSFYAGLAIPSFFARKYEGGGNYSQEVDVAQSTYVIHTGGLIRLNDRVNVQPCLLARYQQSAPVQADVAAIVNYNEKFGIGGAMRFGDSWSAMLRVFATKQITVIYSYDRFISRASNFDSGTHEIVLNFDLVKYSGAPDTRFF